MEQIEEEGFYHVVAMMAERHLRRADLVGEGVEDAPPQARAQRTGGLALGNLFLHHGIGITFQNVVLDPQLLQVLR